MSSKNHELHSNLSLRKIDLATDVDDFMLWASDDLVSRYVSWYPCKTKEQTIELINNKILNNSYFKLICLNNKAIGYVIVTYNTGNETCCRAEIGYVLAREYWGKGIARWAVDTLVSIIFEERSEVGRVEAYVVADNVRSQKFLEKVGFVKEGVLRKFYILKGKAQDMAVFSLLRVDKFDGVGTEILEEGDKI
ncbi:hypothetical protein RND81_12G017900 [Saponaria officinalis]|uniref:N-acetyltransferase domain-containing protein n=1 Tax=Saponaria officinalis TaxID=3572 RepID=A0AAW1H4J9_SAPOF